MVVICSVLDGGLRGAVAQRTLAVGPPSAGQTADAAPAGALLGTPVSVTLDNVALSDAIRALSAKTGIVIAYRGSEVASSSARVTLHATRLTLGAALTQVLTGTGLVVRQTEAGSVVITRAGDVRATGTITGVVLDSATGHPLRGAMITLDENKKGVTSDDAGKFRVTGVSAGRHVVHARSIGRARVSQIITVADGETAAVTLRLQTGVNTLDQVVVTGTVIPTELKAVPNAITVITAKDIEQRGITRIDQLFRGDVPGVFAVAQGSSGDATSFDQTVMFSRGATALSYPSVGVSDIQGRSITNPIKTYVDGVEMADPSYLSQIDPKSIERIEILTGPQASTIYGSNAINGVMQVFTKRGRTSHPQLTLQLQQGWIENNFNAARTPQHDASAQVSSVEGNVSYNAGGSWNYIGPWTPGVQHTRTEAFGGARLEFPISIGRTATDFTYRRSLSQNRRRGSEYPAANYEKGWYLNEDGAAGLDPTFNDLATQALGQTVGLTTSYQPTTWWTHALTLGQDVANIEAITRTKRFASPGDSTLFINVNAENRRSIRYVTTVRTPVTSFANATMTMGADEWQTLESGFIAHPNTSITAGLDDPFASRVRDHDAGAFVQAQLGLHDQLFLTYGMRAEFNPAIGTNAKVLPGRYGVAYTQDLGYVSAKLRGSYGRSIRPPAPQAKLGYVNPDPVMQSVFGQGFYYQLPNPELVPEYQQGGEGGLELYFGSRGSLVVTRYNQTVEGLISNVVGADSVRSRMPIQAQSYGGWCGFRGPDGNLYVSTCPDAQGYVYYLQAEYLNIGSIRNQGWESQGSVNVGPVTARGTYSWTKSRIIGITPKYRALYPATSYPQYRQGAPFDYLPEHTWALGITYASSASTLGLNVNGRARTTIDRNDFYTQHLSGNIRLPQNRLIVSNSRYQYVNVSAGYALTSLVATHRVSTRLEGLLQVDNLLNHYQNDVSGAYASMGRQSNVGLRLRF